MAARVSRPPVRVSRGRRGRLPVALTGTPGTGKSSVAARLGAAVRWREVAELARERGCARRSGRGWEVDVPRLVRSLRSRPPDEIDLIVGHLAHFLPVRSAVVLRCHPVELHRRLVRARRGSARQRGENALSEALDLIGSEVRARALPYVEVDTSGRTPAAVARTVAGAMRRAGAPPRAGVDWLADPRVTAHLLDWGP